jgi:hypothetical protein
VKNIKLVRPLCNYICLNNYFEALVFLGSSHYDNSSACSFAHSIFDFEKCTRKRMADELVSKNVSISAVATL